MSIFKNLTNDQCLDVLANNYIGHLAYVFGRSPFNVPITYYHDAEEKCIISYSNEGHKLNAMRQYSSVAFQVEEIDSIQQWRSVMVLGNFEELEGPTAKMYLHKFAEGVQKIMTENGNQPPKFIKDFSSKLNERGLPIVYRIMIKDILGKSRT